MTEMPTSAACSDGASLMPSPMKPTTWPRRLSARMIRFFCAGDTRANTDACSATWPSAASSSRSTSSPVTTCCVVEPDARQTWRATSSLSPVRIFTVTPSRSSSARTSAASGRTGSAKREEAGEHESRSSSRAYAGAGLQPAVGHGQDAQAVRAQPLVNVRAASAAPASSSGVTCPATSNARRALRGPARARPWSRAGGGLRPSGASTTTDRRRRSKSNGISSTFR